MEPNDPQNIPSVWGRISGIVIDRGKIGAVWGAVDRLGDRLYIIDEYAVPLTQMAIHAEAIRRRGTWIPALFEQLEGPQAGSNIHFAHILVDLQIDVMAVPLDMEAGVEAISSRMATGRLMVFNTCPNWLAQYRRFHRDDKGEIADNGEVLMRATALLALHGAEMAISERETTQPPPEDYVTVARGRSRTGY